MTWLGKIGADANARGRNLLYLTGLVWACLGLACRPSTWSRPVRRVFALQIYFTTVQGFPFMAVIALLMGSTVVVQGQILTRLAGQANLIGPLLVVLLMRELAPLVVNFVVIGRSGAAIAAETASMQASGDVKVLDAMGVDPMIYLVMPRVLGAGVSVFCLTVLFVVVAFASGYAFSSLLGVSAAPRVFLDNVLGAVTRGDALSLPAKTLLPGMATAAIACAEGLGIRGQLTEIPQATTRAVVRATTVMVLIVAIVTAVTYA